MSDPKFKKQIERRCEMLLRDIKDGCNDCPEDGIFCEKHLKIAQKLAVDPHQWLDVIEAEYRAPN